MLRFIYFFFISLKLHEYSAALEDVRGGFVSRRACKYLHLLAVVVTGLWGSCEHLTFHFGPYVYVLTRAYSLHRLQRSSNFGVNKR